MKNDWNDNFAENSIYSQNIKDILKEKWTLLDFKEFENFIQWKMIEMLILLKIQSIHKILRTYLKINKLVQI